jgi:O-antigen/teichoic acid export membrane protein
MVGAVVSQIGLPTLIVREASRYGTTGSWGKFRGLLSTAGKLAAGAAGLCVALLVGFVYAAANSVPSIEKDTALVAFFLVPLILLNRLGGSVLRGLGFVIKGQLAEQLLRPGIFLLFFAVAAAGCGAVGLDARVAMSLHVLAALVAFVIGAVLVKRSIPNVIMHTGGDYSDWGRWKKSLVPLSLIAGLQFLNGQIDILLLGVFREPEDVGIYRVAHQAASVVNMTLFAIALTVEPSIARLHVNGDRAQLQDVVAVTGRMAFALSLAMTGVLVLFGEQLLVLVFGEEYVFAYAPMAILCIGQVGLALAGWAVLMLNMTGNESITARFTVVAAASNLILNAALIPPFGMYGAAAATASTVLIWKLVLAYVAQYRTGIRTIIVPPSRRGQSK